MAKRKPALDASICANWGGYYPEEHRIPAADDPDKMIFVGNMQVCQGNGAGRYRCIYPFTAQGALGCKEYVARPEFKIPHSLMNILLHVAHQALENVYGPEVVAEGLKIEESDVEAAQALLEKYMEGTNGTTS